MATLFAVGLPFTYDGTTNHFATTSGGSASVAAVTSADTLTLDGSSGSGILTVGANFTASAITVNNVNDTLKSDGTHSFNCTGLVTLTTGTINTNTVNMSWDHFNSSGSLTRTLTITSSTITVAGTNSVPWDLATTTSLTVNAGSSTLNMTGGGASLTWREATVAGSGHTWGTVNFTGSGSPVISASLSTFANLGRTGTAVTTDSFQINTNLTITGNLTLAGNTTQGINRLLVQSATIGTQRTLTMTGGAVVINGDVDFEDISITGSPSWTNAGSAFVGDCQGNSGLTTTTPAAQSYTGSGNWSVTANWTSRVPLPQDNVTLGAAASGNVTRNMPRSGANLDVSNFTHTLANSVGTTFFGNVTLGSSATLTAGTITLAGRSNQTITCNGGSFGTIAININGGPSSSGTPSNYVLQDTLTSSAAITMTNGILDDGGHNLSVASFASAGGSRKIIFGTGTTWTLTGTGTIWNFGGTIVNGTATIIISDTSATTKTFAGNVLIYDNLQINGAASSGAVTLSGSNTFKTLTIKPDVTLTLTALSSQTVANLLATGTSGHPITINSSIASSNTVISCGRPINCDWLNVTDNTASGCTPFYAGPNGTLLRTVSWSAKAEPASFLMFA